MEIVSGIHQLKVPLPDNPLGYVNTYLIQGENSWTLVDTGWDTPEAFSALELQVKELGLDFEDITLIIITHIHPDHYGLAGRLTQLSKAKVALHQADKALIESRYIRIDLLLAEIARWLHINGVPEEELPKLQEASLPVRGFVSPALPDINLQGGEEIPLKPFNFEVLWTPGHSPGHICLYEQNRRTLLAGDHVLPTITPNISLHPQSGDNPLGDYLDSLRAMKQLEVDLILPAHEYAFNGLSQRIEQLFHHHEERKTAIMNVLQEEAKTGYEVSSKIPWMLNDVVVSFSELAALDKRFAVTETLAHLELLRNEGKVEKTSRDDIVFYSTSGKVGK